jgi:hypothetical protein
MGTTTRRTQAAAQKRLSTIQPNQPSGQHVPAPAPNEFLGKQERVPQLVYVANFKSDGFLGPAKEFYEFFGIEVKLVKSVHEIVVDLTKRQGVFERLAIVSHAHPRGMLLPMFSGATVGTDKEFFKSLATSDYDGMITMTPFSAQTAHLFDWSTRIDKVMKVARAKNAAVLQPFGLDKTGTPPAGDMSEFFFHCMDVVYLKGPPEVTVKGTALAAGQRKTLFTFIDGVLDELSKRLDGKTVNGKKITTDQLKALRASLTAIPFDDLQIMNATFDLDLTNESMNYFPSLVALVKAVKGGFRQQLEEARTHLKATTRVDMRGCRVGEDPEYLEALGAFLGQKGSEPTVTGPQIFQAYPEFFFDTLKDRRDVRIWLSRPERQHSPEQLRENITKWAELIRVRPLHTDFWTGVLEGHAVRLIALVEKDIPKLFIPAPGLAQITDPDVPKRIAALANFFNVPTAAVPSAAALTAVNDKAPAIRTASAALLAEAKDGLAPDRVKELYEKLRDISKAEKQTIVPETPPTPLRAADIRGYQTKLLDYFDATPLAAVKKFMTAAAKNLKDEDGLYYYMFFAGLPVFVFGRPERGKNSVVVFTPHEKVLQQSWYQCLWKDPLPQTGNYKTAAIAEKLAHTMPTLFNEDHKSVESVLPLPRYGLCMRIRPRPAGEVDGDCGNISNP